LAREAKAANPEIIVTKIYSVVILFLTAIFSWKYVIPKIRYLFTKQDPDVEQGDGDNAISSDET